MCVNNVLGMVECAALRRPEDLILRAIKITNRNSAAITSSTNTALSPPSFPLHGKHLPKAFGAGAKFVMQREQRVLLVGGFS